MWRETVERWALTVAFDVWPVTEWAWRPRWTPWPEVGLYQWRWLCVRVDVYR